MNILEQVINSFLWRSKRLWEKRFQRPYKTSKPIIAIVKTDEIGDYILFRNFISEVNLAFPNKKIALIGNIICKDLALTLDSNIIDSSHFIKKSIYFSEDIRMRYKTLKFVYRLKPEIILQPTYSRNKIEQDIIVHSGSPIKVGFKSDGLNLSCEQVQGEGELFTKLILTSESIQFEFLRNRLFFESFLQKEIQISLPFINHINSPRTRTIVLAPGAGNPARIWSKENLCEVGRELIKLDYDIVLIGSKNELETAIFLKQNLSADRIVDLIGKTTLSELPDLIVRSELVICNDSSIVHLSAALKTKVICISNGNHLNRFVPYPKECKHVYTVLPPDIEMDHPEKYQIKSDLNINSITTDRVLAKVKEVLHA